MYVLIFVQILVFCFVGNIVIGDDVQIQVIINCGVLFCFLFLLSFNKDGICKEVCWIIFNIMVGNLVQIQLVIDVNIIFFLIYLFFNGDFKMCKEVCWVISNVMLGGLQKFEQICYLV